MYKNLLVLLFSFALFACSNNKYNASSGYAGNNFNYVQDEDNALPDNMSDRVFFKFDNSEITTLAESTLNQQADWLNSHPSKKITIEGHCDIRGTREYNLSLGARRAEAAKQYLVSKGVESSRITVVSYGKEKPAVEGRDESAYSQNRRAVTVAH